MKVGDISAIVDSFNADRNHLNHRYASFDYCYSYFHPKNRHLHSRDKDRAALELGFYLASWGMFRGSSFLLTKSYKHFIPLVDYILNSDSCPEALWEIDCHRYNDENIEHLVSCYHKIKELLIHDNNSHLTLVTKVMLGVFANTPAYDRFFINTFCAMFRGKSSFTSFNKKSLQCISDFYSDNSDVIDHIHKKNNVLKPQPSYRRLKYSRAKIVDIYGFTKGSPSDT